MFTSFYVTIVIFLTVEIEIIQGVMINICRYRYRYICQYMPMWSTNAHIYVGSNVDEGIHI